MDAREEHVVCCPTCGLAQRVAPLPPHHAAECVRCCATFEERRAASVVPTVCFSLSALVFYVLTTIGLFILRRTRPDAERPYRALGYPVLPALYIVLAASVMILILMSPTSRTEAVSGLVLVVIGVPVYFLWRKVEGNRPPPPVFSTSTTD